MPTIDYSDKGYIYHHYPYAMCDRDTDDLGEILTLFGAPICLEQIDLAGEDLEHIATHVMVLEKCGPESALSGLAFHANMPNPKQVFVWRWEIKYLDDDCPDSADNEDDLDDDLDEDDWCDDDWCDDDE